MQIRKLPRYAVALLLALTGYAFGTSYQPTSSAITLQFSGDVDANSHKITNLATATVSGDAASKGYVDGVIVGPQPQRAARSAPTSARRTRCRARAATVCG